MTQPRAQRRLLVTLLASALAFGVTAPASAVEPGRAAFRATPGGSADVSAEVEAARERLGRRLGRLGLLSVDRRSGAVRFLARLDGYLTSTRSDDPVRVARAYLRAHATALGLEPAEVSKLALLRRERAGGMRTLEFGQRLGGVPLIDSSLRAHLGSDGRLLALTGGLVPDASLNATRPRVSRRQALAAGTTGVAARGSAGGAELVGFEAGDDLRLGWRMIVRASASEYYDTLVDATSGRVVRRANLVKFANAPVFDNHPGAPVGGTQVTRSLDPFLTSGTNRLHGPNVHAFADHEDVSPGSFPFTTAPPSSQETPRTDGVNFSYPFLPWDPAPGEQGGENCSPSFRCSWDPKTYQSWFDDRHQAATQLFWFVNRFHDHLEGTAEIGFDPASGNFEASDRVIAQVQDGAGLSPTGFPDPEYANNASMLTMPDGQNAFLQTYLWDPVAVASSRPVDGGGDPSIVYHEYTHGLTNRLVTDAQGYGALLGAQAGAIDEGSADWYALDYLVDEGLVPDLANPDVTLASYATARPKGLRTQPIDCAPDGGTSACPDPPGPAGPGGYGYGDFGRVAAGPEVHADGEIWGQTLWQLRGALMQQHGPAAGVDRARRLVTGALRLAPPNPSFLDMRNAILLADVQVAGGDRQAIWTVFSERGMGYGASTRGTNDASPVADSSKPPAAGAGVGTLTGVVTDRNSGQPVAGALVAFAGHDSGLGGEDLSDRTDSTGRYTIAAVPAPRVWDYMLVQGPGYDRLVTEDVGMLPGATLLRNFTLRRNWALASGGATVVGSLTNPDFTFFGCGPGRAIDDSRLYGWSILVPTQSPAGPREMAIKLPAPITLGEVRIDPSATCGDAASAALGGYRVQASTNGSSYTTVAEGSFGAGARGKANAVALNSQPTGVRYIKLRALSSQGDPAFVDVTELQVYAPLPSSGEPPPLPPPPPDPTLRLRFLTRTAKIGPKGRFTCKLAGPKGARVSARFKVKVRVRRSTRRITLATARFKLKSTGRARVVVKVSRRTRARLKRGRLRASVRAQAGAQSDSAGFWLVNKPRRR